MFRLNMRRAQTGLEYIILIGGVVILAAASYFVFKGFLATSGESTQSTMGRGADVARKDLLNMGLEPVVLPWARWYSVGSRFKTNFTLTNQGSVPLQTNVSFKKAGFSDNGVDTSQFEIGFLDIDSGEYGVLDDSASNLSDFVFETPMIPAGEELEVVLSYNNSTPYTPVTSFEYYTWDPDLVLGSVSSSEKTDFAAPTVGEPMVSNPDAGPGETLSITIPVSDESQISGLELSVSAEIDGVGNFSFPVLTSGEGDFGVWSVFSTSGGSVFIKPSYSSGSLVFSLVAPGSGSYSFGVAVVDEWGNSESKAVVVVLGDQSPPQISNPQPANNTIVAYSPVDINISTDEVAVCRYSTSPGTPFSSMSLFDSTNATFHQIQNVALLDGQNYKYYFKCEDGYGNINPNDFLLNFSKSSVAFQITSFSRLPDPTIIDCMEQVNFSVGANKNINYCWLWVNGSDYWSYPYDYMVYMNTSGSQAIFNIVLWFGNYTARVNCSDGSTVETSRMDFEGIPVDPDACGMVCGCSDTANYTDSYNVTPMAPTTSQKVDFDLNYPNFIWGGYYSDCDLLVNSSPSDVFVKIPMFQDEMLFYLHDQGPFPAGTYTAKAHCIMGDCCMPESVNTTIFTVS